MDAGRCTTGYGNQGTHEASHHNPAGDRDARPSEPAVCADGCGKFGHLRTGSKANGWLHVQAVEAVGRTRSVAEKDGDDMEMTNEQKTRDLAEKVCGWTWGADSCGRECWLDCEGLPACLGEFDPFHVRDDADELMGRLTDEQWWDVVSDDFYFQWVALNDSRLTYARFILTATPALISEAVWRATSQPNGNRRHWPVSAELQRMGGKPAIPWRGCGCWYCRGCPGWPDVSGLCG